MKGTRKHQNLTSVEENDVFRSRRRTRLACDKKRATPTKVATPSEGFNVAVKRDNVVSKVVAC